MNDPLDISKKSILIVSLSYNSLLFGISIGILTSALPTPSEVIP